MSPSAVLTAETLPLRVSRAEARVSSRTEPPVSRTLSMQARATLGGSTCPSVSVWTARATSPGLRPGSSASIPSRSIRRHG